MYTKIRRDIGPGEDDLSGLDHLHYRNNVTDPVDARAPAREQEFTSSYVHFGSAERDISKYPDPFQFRVDFPDPFRNVHALRLHMAVLPNVGGIRSYPYMLLDIPEIDVARQVSTGRTFSAMVIPLPNFGNNQFLTVDARGLAPANMVMKPTKARLDGLTVCFRRPDGTAFDGGPDVNGSLLPNHQIGFMFEIVTRSPKNPLVPSTV
jgi:hypothetical protein